MHPTSGRCPGRCLRFRTDLPPSAGARIPPEAPSTWPIGMCTTKARSSGVAVLAGRTGAFTMPVLAALSKEMARAEGGQNIGIRTNVFTTPKFPFSAACDAANSLRRPRRPKYTANKTANTAEVPHSRIQFPAQGATVWCVGPVRLGDWNWLCTNHFSCRRFGFIWLQTDVTMWGDKESHYRRSCVYRPNNHQGSEWRRTPVIPWVRSRR